MTESRKTPGEYQREELDQIREMMEAELPVVCPKCGDKLKCDGVVAGGGSQDELWALTCVPCCRRAILRDVADRS